MSGLINRLDPDERYDTEGERLVERNAQRLLDWRPADQVERTRDAIQIDYGDERGIVVLITPESIEVRLPTIEWTCGSHGPAASSRLWQRVDETIEDDDLIDLLDSALRAREAEYVACRYCGNPTPREHRHDDVCHGCAEREQGIVH